MIERIFGGLVVSIGLLGSGGVVLAQALFDPDSAGIERLLGGSLVVGASVWVMRIVRKVSAEERQIRNEQLTDLRSQVEQMRKTHREDRESWAVDRESWKTERHALRNQLQRCDGRRIRLERILMEAGITPPDGWDIE